ncbi:GNAT superfamily N-acetyltransferase [Streptosporangium becharense]|uniref:GNAT superfamily N-acetyltransferase n=1 Tax=Streptosporangium becharense TaxID=1816182 RepID=A0A7W9IFH0_9ACTN|nr:GNAT family N-acetyltransferase [Streptosporangium becharense]MBB2909269.1 GNAT superfamily N-acetyltransferase [Streptosporangium becharense]MBB5819712.1 GNAT superfamily N-acetyltransferase [Streptosporangium becharense]
MAEPSLAEQLSFVVDPELTGALTDELIDCWTDVTNAGGSVGFVPPVTPDDIRPTAVRSFAACGETDHLLVGFTPEGRVACWLILGDTGSPLRAHWRWVLRVMVHPKHQGRGYGALLLRAADDAARGLGAEALHLTVRGGTGTDGFYARLGYTEVGRIPKAIRPTPGDDRDEIYMVKNL